MFKIVNNERLSDNMFRVTFEAPLVARKAQPGQFLMFRVDEFGERMPITISSYDREAGTVSVIMQRVGSTTALLAGKKAGDYVADVVGPLSNPAEFDNMHKVVVVGGGEIRHRGTASDILPQILADTLGACPVLARGGEGA